MSAPAATLNVHNSLSSKAKLEMGPATGTGMVNELLTSGISVGIANILTNPLDVIKVRLQIESKLGDLKARPLGLYAMGVNIVRTEGPGALWTGLAPSIARGFFHGGARLGLYTPIKSIVAGDAKQVGLGKKILSGSLSGGLAAAVTSPIELVKTRLQAAGHKSGAATSSVGVIKDVIATGGMAGLWKGAMPGLIRAAVLTAAQVATYDEVKGALIQASGWKEGLNTHLASSLITGLVSTTITNPFDMIKTRMFVSGNKYSGPIACAAEVLKKDGPLGFMKGWTASYCRLGPQTTIMFLTAEQLRKYVGLKSL